MRAITLGIFVAVAATATSCDATPSAGHASAGQPDGRRLEWTDVLSLVTAKPLQLDANSIENILHVRLRRNYLASDDYGASLTYEDHGEHRLAMSMTYSAVHRFKGPVTAHASLVEIFIPYAACVAPSQASAGLQGGGLATPDSRFETYLRSDGVRVTVRYGRVTLIQRPQPCVDSVQIARRLPVASR